MAVSHSLHLITETTWLSPENKLHINKIIFVVMYSKVGMKAIASDLESKCSLSGYVCTAHHLRSNFASPRLLSYRRGRKGWERTRGCFPCL